jgi:uncharacterized membrane protein
MKRSVLPALAAAALLCACGPPTDSPTGLASGAGEPADAPDAAPAHDFSGDFNLRGTEPFWLVNIRPQQVLLSRMDEGDFTAPNNGPQIEGDTAYWDSGPLNITLKVETCSDGMSDQVYSYSAVVELEGVTMLKGCGLRPGEPPGLQ